MGSFSEIRRDLREKYPKTASSEQWVDLMKLLELVKAEDFSELLKKVKNLNKPLLYEKKYRLIRKDYDILIAEFKKNKTEEKTEENHEKFNEINTKYQKLKTYSDALLDSEAQKTPNYTRKIQNFQKNKKPTKNVSNNIKK